MPPGRCAACWVIRQKSGLTGAATFLFVAQQRGRPKGRGTLIVRISGQGGSRGRKVVAVSSTWGPGSLLRCPDLLPRLAAELPTDSYQLVGIVHPEVWSWHGRRQVRAWLADSMRRGLILIPPEEGWRAVLAAADVVIGDQGSVTCYAAAIGRPVLLASFPQQELDPASAVAGLAGQPSSLDRTFRGPTSRVRSLRPHRPGRPVQRRHLMLSNLLIERILLRQLVQVADQPRVAAQVKLGFARTIRRFGDWHLDLTPPGTAGDGRLASR